MIPWVVQSCQHRSSNDASRNRFVQARNKCLLVEKMIKDRFVRHKFERPLSSVPGDRSSQSLARAMCLNFCPSNFAPIRNFSGFLICSSFDKTERLPPNLPRTSISFHQSYRRLESCSHVSHLCLPSCWNKRKSLSRVFPSLLIRMVFNPSS